MQTITDTLDFIIFKNRLLDMENMRTINSKIRGSIDGTKTNIPSEIKHHQIIIFSVVFDQYTYRLSQKNILGTNRWCIGG